MITSKKGRKKHKEARLSVLNKSLTRDDDRWRWN